MPDYGHLLFRCKSPFHSLGDDHPCALGAFPIQGFCGRPDLKKRGIFGARNYLPLNGAMRPLLGPLAPPDTVLPIVQ
jgi:hypothetical protein